MTLTLPIISVLYGFSAFLFMIAYGAAPRYSALNKREAEDWLFADGLTKLYDLIFKDTDPVRVSKAFGLEYDKYMVDCMVIDRTPNLKKEAMQRVIGVFSFIFGIFISLLLMSPIPLVVGSCLYILLASMVPRSVHSKAQEKKQKINMELSRFVDLFLSALEIDFPVDIAIMETANALPCILSDELKTAMAETQVGAKNWQQALEAIARKYEIDLLSDFVLDVITAFNKGVSVTEAVSRQAYEIKQSSLLAAKEKTAKMANTILGPLVIFKILPLLIILMLPIIIEIMQFLG